MSKRVKAYIVLPCYNEEEVLHETCRQLLGVFDEMKADKLISDDSRIVFADDGSRDRTWEIISELQKKHIEVLGIKMAHNVGHQNVLYGGLMTVKDECDCAISIDADLQDDIHVIPDMIRKFRDEDCEIVYGVRNKRETDTFFKRTTALGFYKLMKAMGVNIVYNHADYRLMSKKALEGLAEFEERNLFLRGMVPLIGYKSDCVYYERNERFAGESKYPLKKMLAFAFDGITSFSINPIRLISSVGAVACVVALAMLIYAIIEKILGNTNAGWASLMCSIWFIGGFQLLGTGLIGEYIGKMYKEVKRRPRYIVEKIIGER
ncbi:MAG: glycosyltransferase family 2 protein [Clostridiales bacterium]|nr:glycosyltransferase family 2 protein [Clostridiales bacterium]